MSDERLVKALEILGIGALGTALVMRATRPAKPTTVTVGLGNAGSAAAPSAFASRMLPVGAAGGGGEIDREAYLDKLFDDLAQNAMQTPTIRKSEVYVIHSRVAAITEIIRQWGESPKFRQIAALILSRRCGVPSGADGKWCVAEQDWEGEAEALFNEVRKRIRYLRDPPGRDTFSSPDHSILIRSGDCDCSVIVLAVLLRCAGVEHISLRVVQTRNPNTKQPAPDWDHIYLVCDPGGTGKWIALDPSQPQRAGWEVPGASKSATTGKPAGHVQRVKDFPVALTR